MSKMRASRKQIGRNRSFGGIMVKVAPETKGLGLCCGQAVEQRAWTGTSGSGKSVIAAELSSSAAMADPARKCAT